MTFDSGMVHKALVKVSSAIERLECLMNHLNLNLMRL